MTEETMRRVWIEEIAAHPPTERRVLGAAFRLLARGAAVSLEQVAAAARRTPGKTARAAAALGEAGWLTWDGTRITGAAGLSVEPAAHRLTLGGRRLWTWCALDAAAIPAALGADALVESRLADGGEDLRLQFRRGAPQAASREVFVRVLPPHAHRTMCGGT
ncbi:MAG: organomercurial lyase [Thermaerobacter sp.]|jgi:hypothetical protein|nr:organomercurial lyase [Thermaerobacter sp.]